MAQKTSVEFSRIYQGRVSKVQRENDNKELIPVENGSDRLLFHHEIFQDAVNYYLVALSAMALDGEDSLFGKIKKQLGSVWNDFYRNGEKRDGLKDSLIRTLGHAEKLNQKDGLRQAMDLILEHTDVKPETLDAALVQIAKKCKGNVQQPAKTYFPRLCDEKYHGNYDSDKKALAMEEGKRRLIDALYSSDPETEVQNLIPEMDFGWCGIKTQTGKFFTGAEAKESLKEAIKYFISFQSNEKLKNGTLEYLRTNGTAQLESYLKRVDELPDISFAHDAGGPKNWGCRHAMWLLKFFPDTFTIGLLKTNLPESKRPKQDEVEASKWGDDPVKLSRGNRGYVFKAFTDLGHWIESWNKFDMQAFCEALKTINQFNKTTDDRNRKLEKYEKALRWMDGEQKSGTPPPIPDVEEGEEEVDTGGATLPILAGDPRWELLKELLHELGIRNDFTDDEIVDYGISARTIRGFSHLRREMLEAEGKIREKGGDDNTVSQKLSQIVTDFQRDHRDTMGSVDLYQKLASPQYFAIWHNAPEGQKYASTDILADAVLYYEYRETANHLKEPIQITPADFRYSRRISDLRELVYDNKKGYLEGYGHCKDGTFAAAIVVRQDDGKLNKEKVILSYSAPRLCRDQLIGGEKSIYYPPMLQALLGKEEADLQAFQSVPVNLMPDWDKDGKCRILLNFPITLQINPAHQQGDKRFEKQFYYANNANSRLLWPSFDEKATWHKDNKPFSFVSVDLGQRTAGALSRSSMSQTAEPHSIEAGSADGHPWFVTRKYSELLRLPGEGAKILQNGKFVREPYGVDGRPALPEETEDALNIARELLQDEEFLKDSEGKPYRFFPKQNDRLLLVLRRAIGRMKQLQRWLWMLETDADKQKAAKEYLECDWLLDRTVNGIRTEEQKLRKILPENLLKVADRILPLRGRKWDWVLLPDTGTYQLKQIPAPDRSKQWLRGQRGLSISRIEQLENLRIRCQALNRILMRAPGAKSLSVAEMREQPLPDCCPDILRRLDALKEQRVNQTANMIIAQALGLRHKVHEIDPKERRNADIHGEYEKIPGVEKASFIVLENLSRYRFSQDRSAFENSRLMKWCHRQILTKLKMLCEIFAISVLEVDAAYSSKFSSNGIPGFRAEECSSVQPDAFPWKNIKDSRQKEIIFGIQAVLKKMQAYDKTATVPMPRNGGPIFIPYIPSENSDLLLQADVNASFNIGLRGVADASNLKNNNRISAECKKGVWKAKRSSKLAKKIYSEKHDIRFDLPQDKTQKAGNFFVIGTSLTSLIKEEQSPAFIDAEMKEKYPNLMFGSAIWRNQLLQLERCLRISEDRLRKLTAPKKEEHVL